MKHLILGLGLLSMIFLTGCSDDSKSGKSITTRGRRGAPVVSGDRNGGTVTNPGDLLPQGKVLTGEIFESSSNLRSFRSHVSSLVSSFMDPDKIELTSEFGLVGAETGVIFGGSIDFNNLSYRPGMALDSTVQIKKPSRLRVSIYDDLVGEQYEDSNGNIKTYTEVPMDLELTQYSISSGDAMSLVFEDQYGAIMLTTRPYYQGENWSGGFDRDSAGDARFFGAVYYQNFDSYTGREVRSEIDWNAWRGLGYFMVKACGFFVCN